MSAIDRSKAPEGATHTWNENGFFAKRSGLGFAIWQMGEWLWLGDKFKGQMVELVAQAWSGEGLPPVGAVCRVRVGYANELPEYDRCEVIAHFQGESQLCAAYVRTHHDGVRLVGQGIASAFRQILTPEQIAAEEREKARDEVLNAMAEKMALEKNETLWQHRLQVVGEMLDMGYRKQVMQ